MQQLFLKSPYLLGNVFAAVVTTIIVATGSLAYAATPAVADHADSWFAAARAGRTDLLDAMIDAKFPIDATTAEGYTALSLSAYNHRPATVAMLVARGADACLADQRGNTPLMGALFKGDHDIAESLLATPCSLDQANNAGETAVSFAAMFGRLDILPALRAHGADINHVDAQGRTPLALALAQGNASAVAALKALGAK